jgi:pSer/pThr/pTyr-binding forkhead associated (FHA) protein
MAARASVNPRTDGAADPPGIGRALALHVVHTFGRHAGTAHTLTQDVVRFGRAPDNDVVFDPELDRAASSHHAEVRREGDGWMLLDLESKNGTWVKGVRVERCPIAPGDEITFGERGPRIRLEVAGPSPHTRRDVAAAGGRPPPSRASEVRPAPLPRRSQRGRRRAGRPSRR